jgi:hypothetical protein
MAFAFDTLGYAKKLRASGVPQEQAEAHAEAAREFIMSELVTRNDLDVAVTAVRRDLDTAITGVRRDLDGVRRDLEAKLENLGVRLDTMSLRLTLRLGGLIAVGVAVLAAIIKL